MRPTTANRRARTTMSSPPTMRPMFAETSASMSIGTFLRGRVDRV